MSLRFCGVSAFRVSLCVPLAFRSCVPALHVPAFLLRSFSAFLLRSFLRSFPRPAFLAAFLRSAPAFRSALHVPAFLRAFRSALHVPAFPLRSALRCMSLRSPAFPSCVPLFPLCVPSAFPAFLPAFLVLRSLSLCSCCVPALRSCCVPRVPAFRVPAFRVPPRSACVPPAFRVLRSAPLRSAPAFLRSWLRSCVPLLTFPNWDFPTVADTGEIPMPLPRSNPDGGHAICLVGYEVRTGVPGGGSFLFRNSWSRGGRSRAAGSAGGTGRCRSSTSASTPWRRITDQSGSIRRPLGRWIAGAFRRLRYSGEM